MIAREKILVAIPTYDFKVDAVLMQGLIACTKYFAHVPLIYGGNSYVQLARNSIAQTFLDSKDYQGCDWIMWIDSDTRFRIQDWEFLWEGEDLVVCAEYSKKFLGAPAVQWGMGFTRVHRSVYEKIRDWKDDDGQDMIRRYYHEGRVVTDFHTQHVSSEGKFVGEDHGFFRWCAVLDIPSRIETRTRLGHVGQFCYDYPDQIRGYKIVNENDGKVNVTDV